MLLALLKASLSYNPDTGVFTHLHKAGRGSRNDKAGEHAGSPHKDGYLAIQMGGRKYLAHRLAWLAVYGYLPENHIDHINGVRTDNRIANLRDVSKSVNGQNRRLDGGSLGIDFNKASGKWRARITVKGVCQWIGSFDSKEAAQSTYLIAKREQHEGCTI